MLERQLAARELGGGTFAPLQNEKLSHGLTRSLSGRRLKGKGKGVLGAREVRGARKEGGREGNACQETIVFLVINIYQANVKILIGQNLKRSK